MHVTLVHVRVRPEDVDDFIAATRANHEASITEPGNRRFDVLQAPDDPARFIPVSYTHLDVYKRQVQGGWSQGRDLFRSDQLVSDHARHASPAFLRPRRLCIRFLGRNILVAIEQSDRIVPGL